MITTDPANPTHTPGDAVPALDTDLQGLFEDLAGIHPGLDQILSGIRLLALDRHTTDETQTLLVSLAGGGPNLVELIGRLILRLADADTNPALRHLPLDQQDKAQDLAGQYAHYLQHFAPTGLIDETAAVIDGI